MPLDKFALLLVIVFAAAALTVGIAVGVSATLDVPVAGLFALPVLPVIFMIGRVVIERLRDRR